MATASAIDESLRAPDEMKRQKALARASFLTPLAKSYSTDIAVEVASTCVQVHGGMGFVEETGAAQYYRDARILPIYEGTNGIQAIDLITRKWKLENGETLATELKRCEDNVARALDIFGPSQFYTIMTKSCDVLRTCSNALLAAELGLALAAATPFQRALATTIACGYLMNSACEIEGNDEQQQALIEAQFFAATEVMLAVSQCETAVAYAELIATAKFT
jgi:hypothetical protein